MDVRVTKEVPVEKAILNMLKFTRSDYDAVSCIKPGGIQQTTLEFYRESAWTRKDLGMVNMVEGVAPSQVLIMPDTKCPSKASNWREKVIQLWFKEHGQWFEEEVARLRELCEKYTPYQKHFGQYFN